MNITLRKLKLGIMGREGIKTFTADIILDGTKVATCREDGNGGCLSIYPELGHGKTIKEMDAWCKANLPKWQLFDDEMKETDLEMHISNLVADVETQKVIARHTKKHICFQDDSTVKGEIKMSGWKKFTLEQVLANPKGVEQAKKLIDDIQAKGGKILNKNLGPLQSLVK